MLLTGGGDEYPFLFLHNIDSLQSSKVQWDGHPLNLQVGQIAITASYCLFYHSIQKVTISAVFHGKEAILSIETDFHKWNVLSSNCDYSSCIDVVRKLNLVEDSDGTLFLILMTVQVGNVTQTYMLYFSTHPHHHLVTWQSFVYPYILSRPKAKEKAG